KFANILLFNGVQCIATGPFGMKCLAVHRQCGLPGITGRDIKGR
ncbi:hypothetical protein HMPREF9530_05517, partial [Escherichia coli MS 21-1]